jgi:hypothetical protein
VDPNPIMSHSDTSAMESGQNRHSRRRRSRRGDATKGRVYLLLFLLLDRAHDIWIFFATEPYLRNKTLGFLVPFAILDTTLVVAMLFRQVWARYILILYHLYRAVSYLLFIPSYLDQILAHRDLIIRMVAALILDCLISWALIRWGDVRRVTARNYE